MNFEFSFSFSIIILESCADDEFSFGERWEEVKMCRDWIFGAEFSFRGFAWIMKGVRVQACIKFYALWYGGGAMKSNSIIIPLISLCMAGLVLKISRYWVAQLQH